MKRLSRTRNRRAILQAGVMLFACSLPAVAHAATLARVPPSVTPWADPSDRAGIAESRLILLGFENVATDLAGRRSLVAFENRRYRHTADALGLISRLRPGPMTAIERRLGLEAAAIEWDPPGSASSSTGRAPRFSVRYPSDADFRPPPAVAPAAPTRGSADLEVQPRLAYEYGRILDPVLVRFEIEARMRHNPWPGARATASWIIPVRNDFERTELLPDVGRMRPGQLMLDQFFWLPGVALSSISTGYFGDNRYGLSFGIARPVAGGRLLFDAQVDATGLLAFTGDDGTIYSSVGLWTGFAGATWNAPRYDVSVRGRTLWFLYRDRGTELEVRRAMGDVDVAFFAQRSLGETLAGVRLSVPIPPMVRRTGARVRVQPVERFPFSYRDVATELATELTGTASREDWLRNLNAPALNANRDRFERGRTGVQAPPRAAPPRVGLSGMTGFINTPWAGTMTDRGVELGTNQIPKRWAFDNRGRHANDVYYASLGFLPRVEVGVRWTVIRGLRSFQDIVPDSRLTDTDRTASVRVSLIPPARGRPGLALGIEDLSGTRRFHATYAVAGMPIELFGVQSRLGIGYAPRAFMASRHVLDGAFGALELSPWRAVAAQIEHDSEKWNLGIAIMPGYGFRLRAAALNAESLSVGAGWYWPL